MRADTTNICYKDGVAQRGSYHTLSLCTRFGKKILQRHTTIKVIKWHYESQPIQCNAKISQQFRHSHFPGKSQGHDVCFRFQKAKSWLVNQWTRNCLKWCGRTGKSRRDSNRSDAHRYPGPSWDRAVSVPLLQTTPAELTLLIWFDSAGQSQFDRQFLHISAMFLPIFDFHTENHQNLITRICAAHLAVGSRSCMISKLLFCWLVSANSSTCAPPT